MPGAIGVRFGCQSVAAQLWLALCEMPLVVVVVVVVCLLLLGSQLHGPRLSGCDTRASACSGQLHVVALKAIGHYIMPPLLNERTNYPERCNKALSRR